MLDGHIETDQYRYTYIEKFFNRVIATSKQDSIMIIIIIMINIYTKRIYMERSFIHFRIIPSNNNKPLKLNKYKFNKYLEAIY